MKYVPRRRLAIEQYNVSGYGEPINEQAFNRKTSKKKNIEKKFLTFLPG